MKKGIILTLLLVAGSISIIFAEQKDVLCKNTKVVMKVSSDMVNADYNGSNAAAAVGAANTISVTEYVAPSTKKAVYNINSRPEASSVQKPQIQSKNIKTFNK